MNIAITGAKGYLGSNLAKRLRADGHQIFSFVRNPSHKNEFKYSLANFAESPNLFSDLDIDALIHCAWDLSIKEPSISHRINVVNSIRFLELAHKSNVKKIIFISSMSAFDECQSIYGRQKIEVEKFVLSKNGVVIRPGLIWGSNCTGGMFLTLCKLVKTLPIVPMIGSGKNLLYLTHVEDLSDLLSKIIDSPKTISAELITAASPQPTSFKRILQTCAMSFSKSPILIPVSSRLIIYFLKFFEFFKIPIPIRSDSVTGLMHSNKNPSFNQSFFQDINFLGFRDFDNL